MRPGAELQAAGRGGSAAAVASAPRRRKKILFVISTLEVGGTERQLVAMLSRFDRERFEPAVCVLSPGGVLEEEVRSLGVGLHVIPLRGLSPVRHLPPIVSLIWRLLKVVRSEKPDLIHGLLFWDYVLAACAGRLARVPAVVAGRRSLSRSRPRKYLVLERFVNRLTDLVIANSEAVREDTIRRERLPAQKVRVIHNGIDLDRFDQGGLDGGPAGLPELAAGPHVVAVVANFLKYKGHLLFLEAWAEAIRQVPGAFAVLVGDGPTRRAVEEAARTTGMADRVFFAGMRHDVPAILRAVALYVHPSEEEGFSNAILEAMAAGRPVVATKVGGTPEAVIHGQTGLLVRPGDSRELARAIVRVLAHPDDARRMGEAGRRRIAEEFTIDMMVERYQCLYDELLEFRPGRTSLRRAREAQR